MNSFHELFEAELKDMYSSEQQIIAALPELIREAHEPKLKQALKDHLEETKIQAERLESIAGDLKIDLENANCPAMTGILKEGHLNIMKQKNSDVKDATIISACQRVEHYEIAVYGTLIAFAKLLKFKDAESLLKDTLCEESAADKKLTAVAEGTLFTKGVNEKALDRNHRKSA